jgi:hypothetical protein
MIALVRKTLYATVSILAVSVPALAAERPVWPVQSAGNWGNYKSSRGMQDADWVIRCQPVIVVGEDGIGRNVYAQPGCAKGRSARY